MRRVAAGRVWPDQLIETPHSTLGSVETIGMPVKLSETPGGISRGAPLLGEHTREVLKEYGYADTEIDALAEAGAIIA